MTLEKDKFIKAVAVLCIAICLASCSQRSAAELTPVLLDSPASIDSAQPSLVSEGDTLHMIWTEELDSGEYSLVFSSMSEGSWSVKKEIDRGRDWFVNWADFPTIAKSSNSMIAHHLKKSDTATFSYDILYKHSGNSGYDWSESRKLHSDTIKAEHGFVSFSPLDKGRIMAVWLDGRNTIGADAESHSGAHSSHGAEGAMQLRSALIDSQGEATSEKLIDGRTCDCCQTSLVSTPAGTLVAYRDRTENEIRDINVSLYKDGTWSEPRPVFKDLWEINGCPVNGPRLSAFESSVGLVWFTAARDQPEVKISFSDDGGLDFSDPIRVDEGLPLGRVDLVMLNQDKALVSWMESEEKMAVIRLSLIDKNEGKLSSWKIAEVSGARSTGFPQLEIAGGTVFMAWNGTKAGDRQIQLIKMDLEDIYP